MISDLFFELLTDCILTPLGYIYVRLRYGKQYKHVLAEKYDGSYSTTCSVNILKAIGILFVIILGIIALAAIVNLVVSGFRNA